MNVILKDLKITLYKILQFRNEPKSDATDLWWYGSSR